MHRIPEQQSDRPNSARDVYSLRWQGDAHGHLQLIDQTRLPTELSYVTCRDVSDVWESIKMLRVRGAPAIGIAAAYGVLLARDESLHLAAMVDAYKKSAEFLATSRPTAVNLFWALNRMQQVLDRSYESTNQLADALFAEARAIHEEDRQMCHRIGRNGADLIPDGATLVTHCNTGGLATSEYGTALSVIFTCQDQGKSISVFVDETRPLWQGSRLTAWELQSRAVPATIICDSMAAHVMQTRRIDAVLVGADRITARGDVANKIGTYGLAVAARYHRIPFYVAAPSSTFDLALHSGGDIPIEQRDRSEVVEPYGLSIAPEGIDVYNPAFDVTPAELVTAIITEQGVITPVTESNVRQVLQN